LAADLPGLRHQRGPEERGVRVPEAERERRGSDLLHDQADQRDGGGRQDRHRGRQGLGGGVADVREDRGVERGRQDDEHGRLGVSALTRTTARVPATTHRTLRAMRSLLPILVAATLSLPAQETRPHAAKAPVLETFEHAGVTLDGGMLREQLEQVREYYL